MPKNMKKTLSETTTTIESHSSEGKLLDCICSTEEKTKFVSMSEWKATVSSVTQGSVLPAIPFPISGGRCTKPDAN